MNQIEFKHNQLLTQLCGLVFAGIQCMNTILSHIWKSSIPLVPEVIFVHVHLGIKIERCSSWTVFGFLFRLHMLRHFMPWMSQCVKPITFSQVSVLPKPTLLSCHLGRPESRSKACLSCSSHFDPFYGQKVPKMAINAVFWP